MLSAIPSVNALPVPLALITTVEPLILTAPVVFPAVSVLPAPDARVVLPEEESVVNAPVDGVSVPMAVLLIPVAVVLKLAEVIVNALAPVLTDDALRPDKVSAPEVPVIFTAPVVTVKPLEAVNNPADVIVPVPVVAMLPEVDSTPFSLMVSVVTPPDFTTNALFVPALVSLITKAGAVPASVKVKEVAVPVSDDSS